MVRRTMLEKPSRISAVYTPIDRVQQLSTNASVTIGCQEALAPPDNSSELALKPKYCTNQVTPATINASTTPK